MQPQVGTLLPFFMIAIYLGIALLPGLILGGLIGSFARTGQVGFLVAIICAPISALLYCYYAVKQPGFFEFFKAAATALTITTLLGVWLAFVVKGWMDAD